MGQLRSSRLSFAGGDTVHLIVAGPLDQRTGGYLYDARMVAGLRARGREVVVLEIAGQWPEASSDGREDLQARLSALPDRAITLVDGLVGGAVPELLEPHADRLRILPLVHHPLCDEVSGAGAGSTDPGVGRVAEATRLETLERRTLATGSGIIVTSDFTAARVVEMGADPARVRVVEPGTARPDSGAPQDRRDVSADTDMGAPMLLCVGSVVPRKGQLDLVQALAGLADLEWRCSIAGSLERDPVYAEAVRDAIEARGLQDRIGLLGEVSDADLEAAWASADMFVLPSRYEGYGMAFTEALVRGLPVIGTTGGAIPATVPAHVGALVAPGDVPALASAMRELIADVDLRSEAARRARAHAKTLPDWDAQADAFLASLDELTAPRAHDTGTGDNFSSDWLTLREPADHAARSSALVQQVADAGARRGWSTVLDLGSGRGSNLRWLAPSLAWAEQWVALDHDAGLLREIRRAWEGADAPYTGDLRTVEGDLGVEGIDEIASADLVTASALLDLVTEEWVGRLARACADRGAAALLALSWDGTADMVPSDPVAEDILDRVRAHQQGEKGMGVALGPAAPGVTAAAFTAVGMRVHTASTPWILSGAKHGPLTRALVEGWVSAASEIAPERASHFRAWFDEHAAALMSGEVEITVGHTDLLALPADV